MNRQLKRSIQKAFAIYSHTSFQRFRVWDEWISCGLTTYFSIFILEHKRWRIYFDLIL